MGDKVGYEKCSSVINLSVRNNNLPSLLKK